MTKQEFMLRLSQGLEGLAAPSREEILRDLDDHFQEGLLHGLTEEEIAARLGSPEELSQALLEEGRKNTLSVPDAAPEEARREEPGKEGPKGDAFDALAASLADWLDRLRGRTSASSGSKEDEKASSAPQENVFPLPLERVEIRLASMDLRILPGGGDKVICRTRKGRSPLRFEVRDRALCITQEKGSPDLTLSFFSFRADIGDELTVLLPSLPMDLDAESRSGDLTVEDAPVKSGTFSTASGDLRIHCSPTGPLRCRTASGDIDAVFGGCGTLALNTVSGDLDLQVLEDGESIRAESVSGDIGLHVNTLRGGLELKSVSGEIEAELSSVSGEVRAHTVSGDLEMFLPAEGARASLTTRSGDARLEVPGQTLKGTSLSWGSGTRSCTFSSVSGDLTVCLR